MVAGAEPQPWPAVPPLRQVDGLGVLATQGPLTLLCAPVAGQHPQVGALVGALAAAARSPGTGGRRLSELLAELIGAAAAGEFPALCALGPQERGLAVMVHGAAELVLTAGGRELSLAGRAGAPLVARLVTEPVKAIRASIGEPGSRLRVDWSIPEPSAGSPTGPPPAGPRLAAQLEPASRPRVAGVRCRRGHFNHPAAAYCAICGIAMLLAPGSPAWDDPPPPGVLVLDDGTVRGLWREHVVGREPDADPAVAAGRASPVWLPDPQLAPVHARLVIDGWRVRVVDQAGGTAVRGPGEPAWTRLSAGAASELRSGTVIGCGRRELRYYSYRSELPG